MTRKQQIDEALVLLDPPQRERGEWQRQIEHTLDSIDLRCRTAAGFKAPGTKLGKAALQRYVKALRELQKAYDALRSLRPWFSLLAADTQESVIDRELDKAKKLLARESGPPKRDAVLGKVAATAAYQLLRLRGSKPSLTRSGKWEQLAKVLANGAPVFEHMRTFKRALAARSE